MRNFLIASIAWLFPSCALPLLIVEVARESAEEVIAIDPDVPVALADDDTVAFYGTAAGMVGGAEGPALFVASVAGVVPFDLALRGHHDVKSVQVNAAGGLAFLGRRTDSTGTYQGVYTTAVGAPIVTQMESLLGPPFGSPLFLPHPNVALSESGLLAFSTIENGMGGLSRGPIGGPFTILLMGSGRFYNTQGIDVNDSGVVALQMEYGDPTRGLARGILLFDAPTLSLAGARTAIEKMDVGSQPVPSINAHGIVAFALATPQTLRFFDPPDLATGTVVATLVLEPGVYVATPTPFGQVNSLTQLADTHRGFAAFGRVVINDDGVVVFEATLDDGRRGLFTGPDPVCEKILAVGDTWEGTAFTSVRLGEINRLGSISVLTTDERSSEHHVWVMSGLVPRGPTSAGRCWKLFAAGT